MISVSMGVSGRGAVRAVLAGSMAAVTPFANTVAGVVAALLAGVLLLGAALWPRAKPAPPRRRQRPPRGKPAGAKRADGQPAEVALRGEQQPAAKVSEAKQPAAKPQPAPRRRTPAKNAGGRNTVRR